MFRSSNSVATHALIVFLFYIAYPSVDLKPWQLFTAVVVKYSSPPCLYIVAVEVSY